jgi:hypothetical protein
MRRKKCMELISANLSDALLAEEISTTPLPSAVLACFTGSDGRRFTREELRQKLLGSGFRVNAQELTLALTQLEAALVTSSLAPWRLVERGSEWFLVPKNHVLASLEKAPGLPATLNLSEDEKAVLLVILCYQEIGGVSKNRIAEVLGIEPDKALGCLDEKRLTYVEGSLRYERIRARPSALLALGIRSAHAVPRLKEIMSFVTQWRRNPSPTPDGASVVGPSFPEKPFKNAERTAQRRQQRRSVRIWTLPEDQKNKVSSGSASVRTK